MTMDHSNSVDWDGGISVMLCTDAYAAVRRHLDAMKKENGFGPVHDWPTEAQALYQEIDAELTKLESAGHLGGLIRL